MIMIQLGNEYVESKTCQAQYRAFSNNRYQNETKLEKNSRKKSHMTISAEKKGELNL